MIIVSFLLLSFFSKFSNRWQASQIDLAFIDDNFLKTIQSFLQIGTKWQKTFGAIKKL
jgi:hypothetical protein